MSISFELPDLSVCVPYWCRQDALDRMFTNYADMYPGLRIEFSVCDDGSPEPAVVPDGVILTRLPEKDGPLNPCVPINAAVAASSADIVVLTNPEIEHRSPVLYEMVTLCEHSRDYVTATCEDLRGFRVAGEGVRYDQRGRLPVPDGGHFHFLALLRRELWDRAGGFDTDYRHGQACDDNDWLWRLHRVGARFRTTTGVVYHHPTDIVWNLPHNRDLFMQKWPSVA